MTVTVTNNITNAAPLAHTFIGATAIKVYIMHIKYLLQIILAITS